MSSAVPIVAANIPANRSVWQDQAGVPGVIRDSPVPTSIDDGQIMIKVHAWALNPADAMVQDMALPFMKYPTILGEDVAGTVEIVGADATEMFKKGDRVLGFALGVVVKKHEQGAFQDYVVLDCRMACKIPDSMSFTDASVLPLCISTAAYGLFATKYLGMPFPKVNPTSTGKSVFIWGGSSSVGSNAIQLSKAAGFTVITTCSERNFDYVKYLGADVAFDYSDPSVIDKVVNELDKGECVGIFQAAGPVAPACQVAHKSKQTLFVAATNPVPNGAVPVGVVAKMLGSDGDVVHHQMSEATFGGFLPEALAKGLYKVAPVPEVVPTKGLEGIQEGLDILRKGVSAKKIVIVA